MVFLAHTRKIGTTCIATAFRLAIWLLLGFRLAIFHQDLQQGLGLGSGERQSVVIWLETIFIAEPLSSTMDIPAYSPLLVVPDVLRDRFGIS